MDLAQRHVHARDARLRGRRRANSRTGRTCRKKTSTGRCPPAFGALSPSFSADGRKLAFTSTADNLVYGDGNTPPGNAPLRGAGRRQRRVLRRTHGVRLAADPAVRLARRPRRAPNRRWRLGVTALSRADGSVVLYVAVPGVGTLTADARGALLIAPAAPRARRTLGSALGPHAPGSSHASRRADRAAAQSAAPDRRDPHARRRGDRRRTAPRANWSCSC